MSERITPDEAVAALTTGAFREQPGEDDYRNAVESALAFCAEHERGPTPLGGYGLTMVSPAEVREVIEAALGEQRAIVHCIMSFTGADWDLAGAVALARKPGAQCFWISGPAGHDLGIFADGKRHHFGVRKPVPDAEAESAVLAQIGETR